MRGAREEDAAALDATPFNFVAIVLCVSIGAGLLGSLLGLGGGSSSSPS